MVEPVLDVLQGRRDGRRNRADWPSRSMPISARPAIRKVSPMNSSATSSGPPPRRACQRQRPSIAAVIVVIMPACAATRWAWKAGCDIRRKRRQAAPSVVTSPSPGPTFVRSYTQSRVILLPVEQDVLDVVRVRHGVRHIGPGPHPEDVPVLATRLDQERQGFALKPPDRPERARHELPDPGRDLPLGHDPHNPDSSSMGLSPSSVTLDGNAT